MSSSREIFFFFVFRHFISIYITKVKKTVQSQKCIVDIQIIRGRLIDRKRRFYGENNQNNLNLYQMCQAQIHIKNGQIERILLQSLTNCRHNLSIVEIEWFHYCLHSVGKNNQPKIVSFHLRCGA